MRMKLSLIYWQDEDWWLGCLAERPDIMTQGQSLKELEENILDAYRMMMLSDVPKDHKIKELVLE